MSDETKVDLRTCVPGQTPAKRKGLPSDQARKNGTAAVRRLQEQLAACERNHEAREALWRDSDAALRKALLAAELKALRMKWGPLPWVAVRMGLVIFVVWMAVKAWMQ